MLPDIVIGCFMTSSGILHSGNLLKPARFHLIFFRFPKFQSMKWHPFWRSILLLLWSSCFLKKDTKNDEIFTVDLTLKVRTFWETHKIWKNLPHGFDKAANLLSKCQNHEEDFFKLFVLFKKSELYWTESCQNAPI